MKISISGENEIFDEFEAESSRISKNDLNNIIKKENTVSSKTFELDPGRFRKLINQIKLAISLVKDFRNKKYSDIPWRSIAMIAATILYFLNPFDVVPDLLPVFGYTDDALLFASVFKSIQTDLEKYCEWKGLSPDKYF